MLFTLENPTDIVFLNKNKQSNLIGLVFKSMD